MNENIYERISRTLTWKRIISFNVALLVVLVIPLSVRLVQQDTENRSGAAGELEPAPVIPPPNYPVNPPQIERVTTFYGKVGDTIVLIGTNFGDYQWESKVYVGNVEAPKEAVIRWSPTILEVKIPEAARTGKVWVSVNGQKAEWEGNLVLYESAKAAQVGIDKVSGTEGKVWIKGAASAKNVMVELSYVSEPVQITPASGINVLEQVATVDKLGKKLRVNMTIEQGGTVGQTQLFGVTYPGIGTVEIIRAEVQDGAGKMFPLFADPLTSKLLP